MKKINNTRVAGVVKSFVDLRKWSDYDRIKFFFFSILQAIQNIFSSPKQKGADSFDTVVQRYHLSEAQLIAKQKAFYRISVSMCFLGFLGAGYVLYMLVYGSWRAVMLSTVVDLLAWVLAFRYHFWSFQIKKRQLGITFHEWYRSGLMGR